jgi:hypothetical protein
MCAHLESEADPGNSDEWFACQRLTPELRASPPNRSSACATSTMDAAPRVRQLVCLPVLKVISAERITRLSNDHKADPGLGTRSMTRVRSCNYDFC